MRTSLVMSLRWPWWLLMLALQLGLAMGQFGNYLPATSFEEPSSRLGVYEAPLGEGDEADDDATGPLSLEDVLLLDGWLRQADRSALAKRRQEAAHFYYDVNSHLSATGADESTEERDLSSAAFIRGPANDPEEFEAPLGQLTDQLNHRMSNSADRQQLLLDLLNNGTDLLTVPNTTDDEQPVERLIKLFEQQQQQQQQQQHGLDETERSEADTSESSSSAPAPTSEYIDRPLALFGQQLMQGGAGEGRQLLGPEGTFENIQVIKTDSAVPSYCNPPNPCPLGYTAADGCLENFVNSASFSREYQAKQQCSCDNEHSLFNCAAPQPTGNNNKADDDNSVSSPAPSKLETLARTIQNRFGDLASVQKLVNKQQQQVNLNVDDDSNYLVRSARKWSPELNYHKMELD